MAADTFMGILAEAGSSVTPADAYTDQEAALSDYGQNTPINYESIMQPVD